MQPLRQLPENAAPFVLLAALHCTKAGARNARGCPCEGPFAAIDSELGADAGRSAHDRSRRLAKTASAGFRGFRLNIAAILALLLCGVLIVSGSVLPKSLCQTGGRDPEVEWSPSNFEKLWL